MRNNASNMRPGFTSVDVANCRFVNSVNCCNKPLQHSVSQFLANLKNSFWIKLARVNLFPYRESAPSLCLAITKIVCGRTREKVNRVTALRVVAVMTDKQTFWNWPVSKLKSKTVGINAFSPISHVAISRDKLGPGPRPAIRFTSFFNFLPKTSFQIPLAPFCPPCLVSFFAGCHMGWIMPNTPTAIQ